MIKTHFGQHGDECFGCRVQSVSFAASAMPTRKPQAAAEPAREKALVKDRTAFKALRDQGIQPARLKGAAELQDRASTVHEIETGRIIGDSTLATKVESTVKELANQ